MATNGRNRRLEPAYKQHAAVDDKRGVILDVEVTTGELNEGQHIVEQVGRTAERTGTALTTVTADAGYAYGKVYGAMEERNIHAVIPAKAEPIRSPHSVAFGTTPRTTSRSAPEARSCGRSV
ncbi:hypothetical protein ACVWW4_003818 [Bradyrhizobium sp. LB7.1]